MSAHVGHDGPYKTCTHPDCKAYRVRYRKRWGYDRSHGHLRLIDVTPARLHVATLLGAGWSLRAISGAAGVSPSSISRIKNSRTDKAQRTVAAAVLAVDPHQVPSVPSNQTTEPFVSRVGANRRIRALLRMGWTHDAMADHSGVRTAVLINQQGRWTTRSTHDAIAAMYRDLSHHIGPSAATRGRAIKLGYLGPADWDDIDLDPGPDTSTPDPTGRHDVDEAVVVRVLAGERCKANATERLAIIAAWPDADRTLADLERLTGWNVHAYLRQAATLTGAA